MAYATLDDVKERSAKVLNDDELDILVVRLEDAAVIIDAYNQYASDEAKKIVSCNMVIRLLQNGEDSGIPIGATQGSMSGLGYSQSWTIGGGSSGELYLSKMEKKLLGVGNKIGSHSPLEDF